MGEKKCECYVELDPVKGKEFFGIYLDGRVPIRMPFTRGVMEHSTLSGPKAFYHVDVQRLTAEQRAKTVAFIAGKFSIDEGEVERDLDREGLPIREEITVAVHLCAMHMRALALSAL